VLLLLCVYMCSASIALVALLLHTAVLCYASSCYQHLYHCCIRTCTVRSMLPGTVSYSLAASITVSVTVVVICNYLDYLEYTSLPNLTCFRSELTSARLGIAPTKLMTDLPLLNSMIVGMLRIYHAHLMMQQHKNIRKTQSKSA
jgi:hypothetical protein